MKPNKRESAANKYSLSRLRRSLSKYKPRKIKPVNFKDGNSEQYVRLRIKGEKVRLSHIIWRITNRQRIPKGMNIHHIDENKRNNSSINLELIDADVHSKLNLKQWKNDI